jgi:hypothetical protein
MKQGKIITSRAFNKHPLWFRTLNYIWARSPGFRRGLRLHKDELIKSARSATGLHDLGSDFWDEPLDRLIRSLNQEANLHPIGSFISRKRIINLLGVRLRAEYWFRKYPHILEQELFPPLVIVGLQRTGTTKLHRLLTGDPDNRVLRSWEAINPAPYLHDGARRDPRVQVAHISERALRLITPGFFAIHPVEHTAPEEDILLLDVTFLSTTPEATAHVPSYAAWLEETDQSYAYEYGSRLLKLLQWQQPGRRWILKSPHHLEFLPLMDAYYHKPHYLWTHRDPAECIPSFLSMVCHSRAIFSYHVHVKDVTEHWIRKTSYMLNKGLAFRQEGTHADRFTDVLYGDLVKDPLGQLEKIYSSYGGISDILRKKFIETDAANPQGKYGLHEYSLSDFGLTEKELAERNSEYCRLYRQLAGERKDR